MSEESKTFILSFMAIIWKRILITSFIYCKHTNLKIDPGTVLKVMKYEIYSPVGIYNNIKPYFRKSIEDGFLMPNFYRKNKYSIEAVKMFEESYKIVQTSDRQKEIEFLRKYASDINYTEAHEMKIKNGKCVCDLCQVIESWDINLDLLFSNDPFQNQMMETLSKII